MAWGWNEGVLLEGGLSLLYIVLREEAQPLDQTDVTNGGDQNPKGVEPSGKIWRRAATGEGRSP